MFAGISRLLKFLKQSFQIQSSRQRSSSSDHQDEHQFQTAVVNGIGDFAEKLPDFQMMEIMQFIVTSLPSLNQGYEATTRESKFVVRLGEKSLITNGISCRFSRDAKLKLQLLLLNTVKKVRHSYSLCQFLCITVCPSGWILRYGCFLLSLSFPTKLR